MVQVLQCAVVCHGTRVGKDLLARVSVVRAGSAGERLSPRPEAPEDPRLGLRVELWAVLECPSCGWLKGPEMSYEAVRYGLASGMVVGVAESAIRPEAPAPCGKKGSGA